MRELVDTTTGELIQYDPLLGRMEISAADAALEIARIAKDPQAIQAAIEKVARAQREFAAEYRRRFMHGNNQFQGNDSAVISSDWCKSYGINQRTVQRWGKKWVDSDFDEALSDEWENYRPLFAEAADTIATKHTGDHESYTPAKYIDSAREAMGGIDLDPASNEYAQRTVSAGDWFDAKDNGLDQEWSGCVWLNPPYAYPLIQQFIDKLIDEYQSGRVTQAILLTNNSADTKWWHEAALVSSALCQTSGRINFYKATGQITQPTNGQTFFYFGPHPDRFAETFAAYGLVLAVYDNK